MSMVIANNMQAVNTKRQFAISGRGQSSAMEKLSSGYKINTGKDDPSGLVISEKLRSQLNGLKRAQQNTEEGINVMGIAEGALNEMNAILKKMKALAIHSNNTGVTSPDQIAADQAEMDSAIQTLDRIAQTTKFSEDNLLNGAKDIAYETTTSVKGTQQNKLLDTGETNFKQIFKRDDYAVAISFTGSANASEVTGMGEVDFTKQAAKAYLEVDTSKDPANAAQIADGKFTQDQQFTLTGTKGSRAFTFNKGETVATMVSQIKSVADSTGIDAALVFNSDQKIDKTVNGNTGIDPDAEPLYEDQTFTLTGLNGGTAPDKIEAVEFTLGGEMGKFFAEKKIGNIDFTATLNGDGTTFTLKATTTGTAGQGVNNINDLVIAKDWTGTVADLEDAIGRAITDDGGDDAAMLTALKDNLSVDQDALVTLSPDMAAGAPVFNGGSDNKSANVLGGSHVAQESVFGATNVDGKADGTVTLDNVDINWNKVYAGVSDANKADFLTNYEAGNLKVAVKVTGKQNDMAYELVVQEAGGGDVYFTQTVDEAGMAATDLSKLTTVEVGAFEGTKITLSRPSAYTDPNAMTGDPLANAAATPIKVTGGASVTKEIDVDGAGAAAITPGVTPATDVYTVASVTFTGIKDAAAAPGADFKFDITTTTKTADSELLKYIADPANSITNANALNFTIRLNDGTAEGAALSYSVIANVGGKEVVMTENWDGTAGGFTGASIDDMRAINGADVPEALITGLAELTFASTNTTGIDLANSEAVVGGPFADIYTSGTDALLNMGEQKVLEGIFDSTNANRASMGDVYIKFDDVNLSTSGFWDLVTDTAGFVTDFDGTDTGGGEITASIQETIDPTTKLPDGNFNIVLDFDYNGKRTSVTIDYMELGNLTDGEVDGDSNKRYKVITGVLAGMEIRIDNSANKSKFVDIDTDVRNATVDAGEVAAGTYVPGAATPAETDPVAFSPAALGAVSQVGGMDETGKKAVRGVGDVAIFNNEMKITDPKTGKSDGTVAKGVAGIDMGTGAATIQLGKNTDGQGRIYVKFTDDGSYELYKDESLSAESLVGSGIDGQESTQANNSGLEGLVVHMTGDNLTKVKGVYFTVAGIEGNSTTTITAADGTKTSSDGVSYNGDVVGKVGESVFDASKTLITGVELGKNTDADGRIYLEAVYNNENGTVQVNAYKDRNKRPEDLVAQSELMDISKFAGTDPETDAGGSATFVLSEKRNADNTAGTGLGIVLSTDNSIFGKLIADNQSVNLDTTVEFKNLGARIFAQDYGSANFIKAKQDKGSIFHYYAASGDNDSKRMIDSTGGGLTVQVNGQDATLSVNGTQVKTNGLELSMATQDIQADLVFNQGKVGSTTLAQVGYETASIFTKIGALNLGSLDAETTGKYAGLSGLMANAGHVTNERVDNFQGGMQLQLGEGAGDQNRTVVAIKSLTTENLGRVTQGGYWEGDAIYSEKTFTMKDVFGGGAASLKQSPTLAMAIIEQSISDVSELRAQIGAVQTNMLQTNSNNLAVTMENIQKTESGIRDADMADEMTEFTKNQVLQSAAMSMMSQANQSSQNVLQLLR